MNFWYFLIKYSQIIVFTICPDPFKSARLHVWKCLCDSRYCIHFSKPEAAAALKNFDWMSGSTKQRKTAQSHVSVRISGATDQFRICTKVKFIHTIKIPTDFNSSVCSPSQVDHCWHHLAPYLLKQLPPSSSQRGWKWWRQSRWGLLHGHQLSQNASKGHRKCFETSL